MNEIVGIITNIKTNGNRHIITINSKENILVFYDGEKFFSLGDTIKVEGQFNEIKSNTIFNLFNYKKYYLSKNIHYSITAKKIVLIKHNTNLVYNIKNSIILRISKIYKNEYLYAFILGDNSYINDAIMTAYRSNGISHLFSISGMHVTFISSLLLFVLNKIKKSKFNYLPIILVLLLFLFLTNFTPSVIRATFLFIFIVLNKVLNLKLSTLKMILITLFIALIVNPYNIYNIAFKFSYTVSIFLIMFNKIINRHKNYIIKIFITSFISFLSSTPIMINNYFSINLMSIINNIIFVPLVSIIIFPFSFIVLLIPKLSFIYKYLIYFLETISIFANRFKVEIILCKINPLFMFIYYLIIIFVLYKVLKKKYSFIVILIILVFIHSNVNKLSFNTFITFIDVGQGDSALIHFPSGDGNILVDTGGSYNIDLSKNIISYLKSNGLTEINYLILSHGDYDHMGEAINLVENFKVEKVIFNCGEFNYLENELVKVLNRKKIPYYTCIKELNIDNNKLYFLQTKEYDNENDNSNVIYIEINGYKFMFMGDAGVEKEKDILDKHNISDVNVLKVGHHGSKTSSSKEFINEINPKYSIISVGKNNRYGHPNKEVLNNLDNSKIYRTDEDGSIMFKIKNNKLKIETCTP